MALSLTDSKDLYAGGTSNGLVFFKIYASEGKPINVKIMSDMRYLQGNGVQSIQR